MSELLIFSSDNNYYAIDANIVERVLRAVETTPIPNSPHILCGVFDLQGRTLPVISLRRLFSLDKKSVELEDMLIVINAGRRLIALLTDHVSGVYECAEDDTAEAKELFDKLDLKEIVKWEERLVPVIDIETLIDEEIFRQIETKKS